MTAQCPAVVPSLLARFLASASYLAAQQPDTTRRDTAAIVLPPVTVVATRYPEGLFAAPLAVTQVQRQDLFGVNGYGLNDALTLVPGVVAQSRYGTSDVRIAIRGFGARGAGDRSNAGTSRGIRVLLDGFPETEPDGRTSFDGIDLAAAQSVEVVRSNASAVWGNAAGGVISVSTVGEFDRHFLSVESMAGGFGLRRYAARGGATVGPGRLTASFAHSAFAGWRVHSVSRRSLFNLALVTPLAERTKLGVFAVGSANLFRIPGPLTAAQVAADPRQANATYLQRDERRDNRLGRLGVTLDQQLGERYVFSATLYLSPKYLQRSERGTFRDFTRYHLGGSAIFRAHTVITRSVTGTFLLGTDVAYQDGAILFYSLTPVGTRGDTLRSDKREGAGNTGVFVQGELAFGKRFGVIVGARYDDVAYDYADFLNPRLDARKSFSGMTPKIGFNYRRSPTHSFYTTVGGGVEAPAGNETDPASTFGQDTVTALNPLLEPIRSTTYEIGTKHAVAFGRTALLRDLAYDVALYQTEVRNEIVPYRGGRFYFTAGSVRRRGAELAFKLRARQGIAVQSAVAYSDHRYRRYVVDSVHYGQPGRFADYSNNKVVGVPDFTYSVSAGYAPSALEYVRVQIGVQGMSSYFADDANQVRVPAYGVATLTVGTAEPIPVGRGLALGGFVTVNNLFDRAYMASAFLNPDVVGGVPVAFEPGLPRNVLISLTVTAQSGR